MSKSVLISIQPKWCELIAYGKKTVKVRKSRPKLETPFKVYIYCTQNRRDYGVTQGKVIGEFVCDKIYTYTTCLELQSDNDISTDEIVNKSCLSEIELFRACSVSFGVRIFGKILSMTRQKAAVILAVLQGFLTQSAAKD